MDANYSSPFMIEKKKGGSAKCSPGHIRRMGYTATRRGRTLRVKSACIKDRGARGRWQTVKRTFGIGTLHRGDLRSLGYSHTDSSSTRHKAVEKVVSRYGPASTLRKLNAIATYTKRTIPSRSRVYRSDVHYVQKKYFKK
jgi:hypothetical protein